MFLRRLSQPRFLNLKIDDSVNSSLSGMNNCKFEAVEQKVTVLSNVEFDEEMSNTM